MALDPRTVAAFNARRVERPRPHQLVPREKGGKGCRLCVHAEDHWVHAPPGNVVPLRRRR